MSARGHSPSTSGAAGWLLLCCALGCNGSEPQRTVAPPKTAASARPTTDDVSAMFARALPGVVLVVNRRTDGQTGFGAAVLLPGNLALTNRHVIEGSQSLAVMFYDAKRPSHGGLAQDGGLRRYLFENEKALVRAERLRDDAVLDLAFIRIDGDTSSYPRLPWRKEPARIGERVFAVGHPAQNVWSFTTGLVANTHVNAIQVDASINEGNSGGPLVDSQGQIIGINTLRAIGGTQGIGYARPVALAQPIVDGVSRAASVDLSSPEKAQASCARAAEAASEDWAECEDLEATREYFEGAHRRALAEICNPRAIVENVQFDLTHPPPELMYGIARRARAAFIRGDRAAMAVIAKEGAALTKDARSDAPHGQNPFEKLSLLELRKMRGRLVEAERRLRDTAAALQALVLKRTSFQTTADFDLTSLASDTLRMGQRVERVARVDPSHAWIAIAGLNKDGSRYQFSQLWAERGGKWREVRIPIPPHTTTLPPDFPPTPYDGELVLTHHTDMVLSGWLPDVLAALGETSATDTGKPPTKRTNKRSPRKPSK